MLHAKLFQPGWAISPDSDPETYFCLWLNTQETVPTFPSREPSTKESYTRQGGKELHASCWNMDANQPNLSILQPSGGAGPPLQVLDNWYTLIFLLHPLRPKGGRKPDVFLPTLPGHETYKSATESRGIQHRAEEMWQPGWWPRVSKGQERRADGKRRKGGDFGHIQSWVFKRNPLPKEKGEWEWMNELSQEEPDCQLA